MVRLLECGEQRGTSQVGNVERREITEEFGQFALLATRQAKQSVDPTLALHLAHRLYTTVPTTSCLFFRPSTFALPFPHYTVLRLCQSSARGRGWSEERKTMARSAAHDLSNAALGPQGLRIEDGRFIDSYNRTIHLHGANVAGSSKLPTTPNGLSHLHEGFYETHRTVSFVGRPFPLSEAPLHFARLRAWGLPLIRLLVTWESIAHRGPAREDVDDEYVDYLEKLLRLMAEFGLKCFV